MRIPEVYTKRVTPAVKARSRGATAAVEASSSVAIHPTDQVEFSARAGEVAYARRLAIHSPDIREPLVEELFGQIERGQYSVSGSDVAPVLIRDHAQFNSAGRLSN